MHQHTILESCQLNSNRCCKAYPGQNTYSDCVDIYLHPAEFVWQRMDASTNTRYNQIINGTRNRRYHSIFDESTQLAALPFNQSSLGMVSRVTKLQ